MTLIKRLMKEKRYERKLFLTPTAIQILEIFYSGIKDSKKKDEFIKFLGHIWQTMVDCYSKTTDPIDRVLETYELFDQVQKMDEANNKERISCKKGCSHCCYLHVTVTPDEAAYMAAKVREFGADEKTIEVQSKYDDPSEWLKMKPAVRKCVFLEDGVCGIYEDRPLSCRNYRVTGDPAKCDTSKGSIIIAQVLFPLSEWVHCVSMSLNGGTQESMAYGINKRLKSVGGPL